MSYVGRRKREQRRKEGGGFKHRLQAGINSAQLFQGSCNNSKEVQVVIDLDIV